MINYWSHSGYFLCFDEVIEDLLLCMKKQVFANWKLNHENVSYLMVGNLS